MEDKYMVIDVKPDSRRKRYMAVEKKPRRMRRRSGSTKRAAEDAAESTQPKDEKENRAPKPDDEVTSTDEDAVDAAIEMTFPASDPPAWMG